MSGGSLDYICFKVEVASSSIRERATCPEHIAFADHLDKVAAALHDIEWMFSGDTSSGDEIPAIMECITPAEVLDATIDEAKIATERLEKALENAKGKRKEKINE
jgi:RNase P/RNase MRP subunit p30